MSKVAQHMATKLKQKLYGAQKAPCCYFTPGIRFPPENYLTHTLECLKSGLKKWHISPRGSTNTQTLTYSVKLPYASHGAKW